MGKGRNGLPDRWEIYKPVVNHVAGTRFLPFKVPLKEEILIPRMPNKSDWFTPALLCEMKPELKAIIDLTDTFRYYNPEEFTSRGLSYKKINIAGRKIPSKDKLREFYKTVDEFTNSLPEDALIGVHCTHGLNRTGYLICKYMVTRMEIDPEEAINRFEKARGHKMEHDYYLSNIKNKSEMTSEENVREQESFRAAPHTRPTESNWRSEPRLEPKAGGPSRRERSHSRLRNSNYSRNQRSETSYDSRGDSRNDVQERSYSRPQNSNYYSRNQRPEPRYDSRGDRNDRHYGSPLDQCYDDGAGAGGHYQPSNSRYRRNQEKH